MITAVAITVMEAMEDMEDMEDITEGIKAND